MWQAYHSLNEMGHTDMHKIISIELAHMWQLKYSHLVIWVTPRKHIGILWAHRSIRFRNSSPCQRWPWKQARHIFLVLNWWNHTVEKLRKGTWNQKNNWEMLQKATLAAWEQARHTFRKGMRAWHSYVWPLLQRYFILYKTVIFLCLDRLSFVASCWFIYFSQFI